MQRFERRPALVFVTADEEGALEAFDLAAVDYLLKPVRTERLHRSVSRIVEALRTGASTPGAGAGASAAEPEMIAVTLGGTTRMIRRDEVRYVQAQGDYARLHTEEASYLVRVPMADLERQWADAFVRIHRSYLVAIPHVTRIRLGTDHPSVTVGAAELPVSRRLLPALRERLESATIRPRSMSADYRPPRGCGSPRRARGRRRHPLGSRPAPAPGLRRATSRASTCARSSARSCGSRSSSPWGSSSRRPSSCSRSRSFPSSMRPSRRRAAVVAPARRRRLPADDHRRRPLRARRLPQRGALPLAHGGGVNAAIGYTAIAAVAIASALIGFYGLRVSRTTSDFYVASRTVRPWWNASAIGGEYLSAASFLGIAGLILLHGLRRVVVPDRLHGRVPHAAAVRGGAAAPLGRLHDPRLHRGTARVGVGDGGSPASS